MRPLALVVLVVGGCAPAVPSIDDLVGCYEVEIGSWEGSDTVPEHDSIIALTDIPKEDEGLSVRLDDEEELQVWNRMKPLTVQLI